MLVLARRQGESIHIGDEIVIKVAEASGNRVKLCIDAPREVRICRGEVAEKMALQSEHNRKHEQIKQLRVAHQADTRCVLQ